MSVALDRLRRVPPTPWVGLALVFGGDIGWRIDRTAVRDAALLAAFVAPFYAGKPPVELLLSGPTDVVFGAVDYHSGSVLPSTVAHGLGFVLLDYLVLRDPVLPPARVLETLGWLPVPL